MMDNIYSGTIWVSVMANIPYDLHITIIYIFCGSWQRKASIFTVFFRYCTWALKSYSWGKIAQILVCICRILDCVKSSKYNTIPENNLWVSFRPHNHCDCCTQRGWK